MDDPHACNRDVRIRLFVREHASLPLPYLQFLSPEFSSGVSMIDCCDSQTCRSTRNYLVIILTSQVPPAHLSQFSRAEFSALNQMIRNPVADEKEKLTVFVPVNLVRRRPRSRPAHACHDVAPVIKLADERLHPQAFD